MLAEFKLIVSIIIEYSVHWHTLFQSSKGEGDYNVI